MRAKLVRVLNPVAGGPQDNPGTGSHYVGIVISLTNTSHATYSDMPIDFASLWTNNNEQAQGAVIIGGPCADATSGFAETDIVIPPGKTAQGCIPFTVTNGLQLARFTFYLEYEPHTAQWVLN